MPERIMLNVMVNLDQFPGAFHTPEQAVEAIQSILLNRIGHYEPIVVLAVPNTED